MATSELESNPEWIDNKFFETVLRQYKNDESITVVEFTFNGTFRDHFASEMYRVNIEFNSKQSTNNETIKVVVKSKVSEETLAKGEKAGGPLFDTEISMYRNVLPTFKKLFESKDEQINIYPELVYVSDAPNAVIILLDLSYDGYKVLKGSPSDLQDSKLIFQRLAKFHAASYYYAENNNVDFTNYKYSIFEDEMLLEQFFRENLCAFRESMKEWEDCEQYYDKIDWLIENVADVGKKCYIANKPGHGYNVLNHGDFHLKNMLMKMNGNEHIEDLCFIDYQFCAWCSPIIDIVYYFGVIKRPDLGTTLENDELLMFYHQEFVNSLKQFGFTKSPPTLLDLNVELLQHGALNTIIWICFLPYSFIDISEFDAKDIMGEDRERTHKLKRTLYNNPLYKKFIQNEMKSWIAKGWL